MKPQRWLVTVLFFTFLSLLATYLISSDSFFVGIRYVLGFVFVVFLPGYCLVNVLFLGRNRLDFVENLVLSIALSLGLAGLVGLFLGLSPIGINFVSITTSLGLVVTVLTLIAYIRRSKEKDLPVLQV
ncbi:MAG: DUF1616 domain-containing protein [Crenarchaeota archaeon]|nr:DUF1616 domain-containing protein [Thermoproteota archaeon]